MSMEDDKGNVEEVSAPDDLRSSLEAAFADDAPQAPEAAPVETAAQTEARNRDEQGRFASKEATHEPAKAVVAETPIPDRDKPAEQAAQDSNPVSGPPVSWSADAKQAWSQLPPAVQAAAIKREAEAANGVRQWSEKAKLLDEAIAPVREQTQRRGISEAEGIKRLTAAQAYLDRDPVRAIAWLAQSYGVDLSALGGSPQMQQPAPVAPAPQIDIEGVVNRKLGEARLLDTIEQFRSANPHFDAVQAEMEAMVQVIRRSNPDMAPADVLKSAYERATRAHPEVWASIQAEADARKNADAAAEAARQNVARAKGAAISLKGSPGLPGANITTAKASLREELESAWSGN